VKIFTGKTKDQMQRVNPVIYVKNEMRKQNVCTSCTLWSNSQPVYSSYL